MALFDFITNLMGGGELGLHREARRGLERAGTREQEFLDYLRGQFEPYAETGRQAMGEYFPAIEAMREPQQFYEQMMSGYEMSPETQMAIEEGTRAATQAAAARGGLGGGQLLKDLQRYGQQMAAADQQRWLKNMLGIYGGYTGGLESLIGGGRQALGTLAPVGAGMEEDIAKTIAQIGMGRGMESMARYQPYSKWFGTGMADVASMLGGGMGGMAGMFGGAGGAGGAGQLMGLAGAL